MGLDSKTIRRAQDILSEWNPLGDRASTIHDLNDYHTEAIDILFHLDSPFGSDEDAETVQKVLNDAFDLDLNYKECSTAAQKLRKIKSEQEH